MASSVAKKLTNDANVNIIVGSINSEIVVQSRGNWNVCVNGCRDLFIKNDMCAYTEASRRCKQFDGRSVRSLRRRHSGAEIVTFSW